MYWHLREKFVYLLSTFRGGNGTIVLARAQIALGSLYVGLQQFDLTTLDIPPKYIAMYVIGSNVVAEYVRRHNESWDREDLQAAHEEDEELTGEIK